MIFNSYVNDGSRGSSTIRRAASSDDDILTGAVPLAPQAVSVIDPDVQTPRSWQTSLGFQKQLSPVMGVDANLVTSAATTKRPFAIRTSSTTRRPAGRRTR